MSEELINGLLALKIKIGVMEKEIGLPKNNLAGILKGSRPFPQKWVKKVEDYIKLKTAPQVEKFTMDEIEKKLYDPSFLSVFLLRHPHPEIVRVACLHYLGDGHQKLDDFMQKEKLTADELIKGYNPNGFTGIIPKKEEYSKYVRPVDGPKTSSFDVYKEEILNTTYPDDLQKIMKEIDRDPELSTAKKGELKIIANGHRTNFC
jgi:hypothetical protein